MCDLIQNPNRNIVTQVWIASHIHSVQRFEWFTETIRSLLQQTELPSKIYVSYSQEKYITRKLKPIFTNKLLHFIWHPKRQTQFEHLKHIHNLVLQSYPTEEQQRNLFVFFCDDDDIYHPDRIRRLKTKISSSIANVFYDFSYQISDGISTFVLKKCGWSMPDQPGYTMYDFGNHVVSFYAIHSYFMLTKTTRQDKYKGPDSEWELGRLDTHILHATSDQRDDSDDDSSVLAALNIPEMAGLTDIIFTHWLRTHFGFHIIKEKLYFKRHSYVVNPRIWDQPKTYNPASNDNPCRNYLFALDYPMLRCGVPDKEEHFWKLGVPSHKLRSKSESKFIHLIGRGAYIIDAVSIKEVVYSFDKVSQLKPCADFWYDGLWLYFSGERVCNTIDQPLVGKFLRGSNNIPSLVPFINIPHIMLSLLEANLIPREISIYIMLLMWESHRQRLM